MLTCKVVIKFYKKQSNRCPIEDFLDSLSAKQAKKVTWVLRLIEETPEKKTDPPLLFFLSHLGRGVLAIMV